MSNTVPEGAYPLMDKALQNGPLNCVICGVGGQGNVLASRLIADMLLAKNEHVKTAETIGMAQRGGSVMSHVRGGHPQSPLVPRGTANVMIAFEPGEAVRCIDFLAPDGLIVVNTRATQSPSAALERSSYDGTDALAWLEELPTATVLKVDGDAICKQVGSPRVLNIVLLAAAVKTGAIGCTREALEDAIRGRVKERFHAMNLKAIDLVFGA